MKSYDIDDMIDEYTVIYFSCIYSCLYWGGIIAFFLSSFGLVSGLNLSGAQIAVVELGLYFYASYKLRLNVKAFRSIPLVPYYWYMMTILTFVWETAFILNYDSICDYSSDLIVRDEHVWRNRYPISTVIPWKLSRVFYAEYGAYADREYMLLRGDWSRIIEGTHAYLCGIFAIGAMVAKKCRMDNEYLIMASVSMGTQLMNSILYMGNYFIQIHDKFSVNYDRANFPSGYLLSRRPFMYVNIFWTLMPIIAICHLVWDAGLSRGLGRGLASRGLASRGLASQGKNVFLF